MTITDSQPTEASDEHGPPPPDPEPTEETVADPAAVKLPPSRRDRTRAALAKDPLDGISRTFRILFWLALAITALVVVIVVFGVLRSDPAPTVIVQGNGTPTQQADGEGAAPATEANALVQMLDGAGYTMHPQLGRLLYDPQQCDADGVCGYPLVAESNAIAGAIAAGPRGQICDARVGFSPEGAVELSYGPDYPAGFDPVANCDAATEGQLESGPEVVEIEEGGRLGGIPSEELDGE